MSSNPQLMTGSIWSICSPPGRVNLGMTPRSHPLRSSINALMSDWIWSARRSVMKIGSTWQNYTRTPWSLTKNMQKLWVAQVRLRRGNMVANRLVDECHTILAGVPSTRQTVRGRRQNGHYVYEGAVDSVQPNTIYKTLYRRILGNPLLQKLMLFRVRVVQCCPLVC